MICAFPVIYILLQDHFDKNEIRKLYNAIETDPLEEFTMVHGLVKVYIMKIFKIKASEEHNRKR